MRQEPLQYNLLCRLRTKPLNTSQAAIEMEKYGYTEFETAQAIQSLIQAKRIRLTVDGKYHYQEPTMLRCLKLWQQDLWKVVNKATDGPWEWEWTAPESLMLCKQGLGEYAHVLSSDRCPACTERNATCTQPNKEDMKFIEESRAAVPKLLEEVSELAMLLRWVTDNYRSSLAGKSVRDADECILGAEKALKDRIE